MSYSEWYGRVGSKQGTKALQPMWSIGSQLQEVSSECTSRCFLRRSFRKSQRWSTSYVQTSIGENCSWKAFGVMIHNCISLFVICSNEILQVCNELLLYLCVQFV